MATPHLSAKQGEIAECVLLPGDPLRARYIAENYLENPVCYNEVRNMLGFTGYYNGKRISVQGTGMGIPSISIYTHELIHYFGAKRLIRTGSCGAIQKEIELRDIILSMSASTDSGLNRSIFNHGTFAPVAADELLFSAREIAGKMKINVRAGNVLTSDRYYYDDPDYWKLWADYGVMCIEMETAALYTIAAKNKVQALSILTVSDSIVNSEHCSAEERETSFNQMIELALEIL